MTWNTLTDLSAGQYVTETHMDHIRQNIEHLGAMKAGGTALSDLAAGFELGKALVGSYTGNGAATQAITGLAYQPKVVLIFPRNTSSETVVGAPYLKTNQDTTYAKSLNAYGGFDYEEDYIISLDASGFTVGDGTDGSTGNALNINGRVYTYIAWG